ncbi:MAG: hypothetical protein GY790_00040 [Bacteroidetes bacterium]|nr:hypothetical protein [Bacteroidota bacterium]
MSDNELSYIEKCLGQIEEQLNWGSSHYWKQRDYEALSDLIYEKTKVQLSLSTLKRIWQKSYKQLPQPGTLNALVQFLGYSTWQEFKAENVPGEQVKKRILKSHKTRSGRKWGPVILVIVLAIAGFLLLRYVVGGSKDKKIEPAELNMDQVRFTAESISDNIPNTVIFKYQIPTTSTDTLMIQQSWDRQRRERISGLDSVHTSMYYYPGYFSSKLILNDRIIREMPVHIRTRGWQALATETGRDEIPTYIPQEYTQSGGGLYVSPEVLKEYNVDLKTVSHWIHFYNSRDFGELSCTNFILETRIRNAIEEGALTCQEAYVQIHFEDGHSLIPISIPGCVSNLTLRYIDYQEKGRTSDLSGFGCNMDEWQNLKIAARGKSVSIMLNDRLVRSFTFGQNSGRIKYLQYRFKGCGKVDDIILSDTLGNIVYTEQF